MNVKKYKEIIEKTAVYPQKVNNFGIAYTFLGMMDEMFEVLEIEYTVNPDIIHLRKEKGDVLWYMCAFCKETGMNFEKIIKNFFDGEEIDIDEDAKTKMFGYIKKFYRDNKALDLKVWESLLHDVLEELFPSRSHEEFEICLSMNYDKLMARRATNTIHGDGDDRETLK